MRVHLFPLLVLSLACGSGPVPAGLEPGGGGPATGGGSSSTGIEGTAHRGPTRPVCQVNDPCVAPFTADFEVWQGDRIVARFRSDAAGHFQVRLEPGTYRVVPDVSAGVLARSQAHEVIVGPTGFTHVELDFDTGIR